MPIQSDVLVVGGGLAGLTAGIAAARAGATVRILSATESSLRQASGLIDILGYPAPEVEAVVDPFAAVSDLPAQHPYRTVGVDGIRAGLALFDEIAGGTYAGNHTDRNALVPTAGGSVKPTARYPATVAPGLASDSREMVLVGFESVPDFDAPLAAARLRDAGVPFPVRGNTVTFPADFRPDAKLTRYARALEADEPMENGDGTVREILVDRLVGHLGEAERIGLPAILGQEGAIEVRDALSDALGAAVFEVPAGPPSLPGMRLASLFQAAFREAGGTLQIGTPVVGYEASRRIERVIVDRNGAEVPYRAAEYVLATGGLVGKGIRAARERVREPVFGCHVPHPEDRYDWFVDEAFGEQPFARFGLRTDTELRPLDERGEAEFENLRAAGAVLGGADFPAEKSGSGISLATGAQAGRLAAERGTP